MGEFVTVARVGDVPPGTLRKVELDGEPIALAHVDGRFCATQGKCLHLGGPLGEGHLDGSVVTCPWHGWQYDVRDGRCDTFSSKSVATYPVRVDEEGVFVTLP